MATNMEPLPAEPEAAAREARLRYVSDELPGLSRRKAGRGFAFYDTQGRLLRDAAQRRWIKSLAIPPAWTDVWISPSRNGHILATGRDAKGRKQYIYHPRWRELRKETNFHRLLAFGGALPELRHRIDRDLRRHGLPRERVIALVVRLLQATLVRVGNREYAQQNDSYGLTTLTSDHVELEGDRVRFEFVGKSGQWHDVDLRDRRAARVVRRCQELPGQNLFQYLDAEGVRHSIDSDDVNQYLSAAAGEEFTAKLFRTWGGSAAAVRCLLDMEPAASASVAERNLKQAIKQTAQTLRNTVAICRQHYVHPLIGEVYLRGELHHYCECAEVVETLSEEECVLMALLREAR